MATDIITITGHNLTLKEIIELPSQIDSWDNLKKVWFDDYKNKSDFYFPQQQANIWDRLKSYLKFSQNSDEYLECKEYLLSICQNFEKSQKICKMGLPRLTKQIVMAHGG